MVVITTVQAKRHKRRLDKMLVPTMGEALNLFLGLPEAVKTVLDAGDQGRPLARATLGRSLGVSRQQVWAWQRGRNFPREALGLIAILLWAEKIRQEKEVNHDDRGRDKKVAEVEEGS